MTKLNTYIVTLLVFTFIFSSCSTTKNFGLQSHFKTEIMKAENDFNKLVNEKGIAEGFYQFADSNAVIKRENDTLIKGRSNILHYYSDPKYKNASVTWSPDFVEVSQKGDLAYTFGKYIWSSKDANGKEHVAKGIFHTVWKRQKDGSWKYIWD